VRSDGCSSMIFSAVVYPFMVVAPAWLATVLVTAGWTRAATLISSWQMQYAESRVCGRLGRLFLSSGWKVPAAKSSSFTQLPSLSSSALSSWYSSSESCSSSE
jgi:hypothetical protein